MGKLGGPQNEIYVEERAYQSVQLKGKKIIRLNHPLSYLNAEAFKTSLLNICKSNIRDSPEFTDLIIIDFSQVAFIDEAGAEVLIEVTDSSNIAPEIVLSSCNGKRA